MIEFSRLLLTFWNDYKVLIWNLNKTFQAFVGAELLLFITNSPKIVTFLKATFEDTDTLKDLCDGLELWQKITPFLVITSIKNIDEYNELKKKFVSNLKKFYTIGGRSFLTKKSISSNGNIGNDEKIYMHT